MDFKKAFISELKPARYNPRKDLQPSDPEYQRIKKSIEEFGYVDPIIVNADYTVIGGHQRLKVLKELGQAQIDVVVVDIPKDKEKALNVALNKISGEWDTQRLTELLGEIKADGLLELTGFDEKEFDQMLRELHKDDEPQDSEPQISRAEELRKEWGTELGQMWQCGDHRVLCGDCTDPAVVKRLMQGEKADMVFTDPPYGMDKKFKNDSHKDMRPFHHSWISVIKDYAPAFLIWYDPKHMSDIIVVAEDYLGRMTDYFHMYKPNDIAYPLHSWIRISESMIVFGKPDYQDIKPFSHDTYLWNHTKKDKSFYHPSVKPMEIVADLIPRLGGETYLDPFLGSGTTMIACENLGRKCRGCEIDPGYVAVILQRYKDTFNKQPVLIE